MNFNKIVLFCFIYLITGCFNYCISIENAIVNEKSGLFLRTGPGQKYELVTTIPYKSQVEILKKSYKYETLYGLRSQWVYVKYGQYNGWVFEGFLTYQYINLLNSYNSNNRIFDFILNFFISLLIVALIVLFIFFIIKYSSPQKVIDKRTIENKPLIRSTQQTAAIIQKEKKHVIISNNETAKNRNKEKEDQYYEMGLKFETLIAETFSNSSKRFSIVHWTNDIHRKHNGIFIESDQSTDFIIRHKETNEEFGVECKYRSYPIKNILGEYVINWATKDQIERYSLYTMQSNYQIFVIIGLGGVPNRPNDIFCIPLKQAQKSEISIKELNKYKKKSIESGFYWNDRFLK